MTVKLNPLSNIVRPHGKAGLLQASSVSRVPCSERKHGLCTCELGSCPRTTEPPTLRGSRSSPPWGAARAAGGRAAASARHSPFLAVVPSSERATATSMSSRSEVAAIGCTCCVPICSCSIREPGVCRVHIANFRSTLHPNLIKCLIMLNLVCTAGAAKFFGSELAFGSKNKTCSPAFIVWP